MIATTIIPRAHRARTTAEMVERLVADREATKKRITAACALMRECMGVSAEETRAWRNTRDSLLIDLEMIEDQLRSYAPRPDRERYASEIEASRLEDQQFVGASNGAIRWED